MDGGTLAGIVATLVALWAALLVLFWVLRPKGVSVREILGLIPDVLRLPAVGHRRPVGPA